MKIEYQFNYIKNNNSKRKLNVAKCLRCNTLNIEIFVIGKIRKNSSSSITNKDKPKDVNKGKIASSLVAPQLPRQKFKSFLKIFLFGIFQFHK